MYETLTNKAVKFRFHAQLKICAYVKIIKFIKIYQIIMIPFRWKVVENQHQNRNPSSLVNFVDAENAVERSPLYLFWRRQWCCWLVSHVFFPLQQLRSLPCNSLSLFLEVVKSIHAWLRRRQISTHHNCSLLTFSSYGKTPWQVGHGHGISFPNLSYCLEKETPREERQHVETPSS